MANERNQPRINEQIRVSPVRTIGAEGQMLGILPIEEAIARAREANLDLVEVGPNERPPVCKVMDYGKFKYQLKKRQHKAHAHQMKLKEIRLRPKIGQHDVEFKAKHAREFLEHKDKVLISVVFRGRELAHIEEGQKIVQQVINMLEDVGKVESQPVLQGRRIVCTLAPK